MLVLKFEFGDTGDTVSTWYFPESVTPTEAAFNTNALSTTSTFNIDENTLSTVAVGFTRAANAFDEIRIGDTFDDIISLPAAGAADADASTVSASPQIVGADGVDTSIIIVSLKDSAGIPVEGEEVILAGAPGVATIDPAGSQFTDVNGQVTFGVSSTTTGVVEFTATAVGAAVVVTDTASVEFLDATVPLAFNVSFTGFTNIDPALTTEVESELVGPADGLGTRWNQYAANSSSGGLLITSFSIPGAEGVINQSAKTISLAVPSGTNLATLAPTFTLSSGVCNQTSGAPPSPTFAVQNLATYTVTDNSTDPATINNYIVTVSVDIATTTLVTDLGSTPGTVIEGGTFIGTGPTNLPLPELPPDSILRSIAVNTTLAATDNENLANDLTVLLDPTPETPGGDFSLRITGPAPTQDFGPPTATLTWVGGAGGEGTPLVDTKTDADWAAVAPVDLATTGLFLGNAYGGPTVGGTWSGTITLTYDLVGAGSPFENWAGGEPFAGDANGDGVSNGLAFLLGAADPDANALGLLPAISEDAGGLVLSFSMLNAASRGASMLSVEHSSDLGIGDPWSAVPVPETTSSVGGVSFTVNPGNPLNSVIATVPNTEASGGKLFGRLSAKENRVRIPNNHIKRRPPSREVVFFSTPHQIPPPLNDKVLTPFCGFTRGW